MRREPIKPKFQGCVNCSNTKPEILEPNEELSIFGILEYKSCGYESKWFHDGERKVGFGRKSKYVPISVNYIESRYSKQIKRALWSEIRIATPGGCFTYEYNKDDGNWYLVEQHRGF